MNPRKLFATLVVAVLVAGGIWYFTRPLPAEPAKTADAPKPAAPAPAAPKPAVAPQVVAPKAPVAVVAPAPKPAAPEPAAPNSDAVTELNNTIGDMASLLQAGDMATLMDKYMPPDMQGQMTPEMKAQMLQQMQDPQVQQQMQMMVQALQSLQGQTPTFNDAGDRATYQMTPPAGMIPPGVNAPPTIPVTFMKVNGRWYTSNGPGL